MFVLALFRVKYGTLLLTFGDGRPLISCTLPWTRT